jgi:hypothetical protein
MQEAALREKGIEPETEHWPRRSRNWALGHGAVYDERIGKLVKKKKQIAEPLRELVKTIAEGQERTFQPDRENDKLTKAPKNKERTRQTRGLGSAIPWRSRFAEDSQTYRSRERAKKRKAQEEPTWIESIEKQQAEMREMYLQQQKALEELKSQGATQNQQQLEHASGDPSQRSSMASADLSVGEAPMDRYPMDDISGKTSCEMHQSMKNISMKVAVGYALPSGPGQIWHGREIRAGYARVGVDAIVLGYESLELDVAGPEEETTHGEVLGGVILWDKKNIMFPGSAPRRPPPPLSPRNSPPLDDDRDNYQSPSPHRSLHQCQPPPPPPP